MTLQDTLRSMRARRRQKPARFVLMYDPQAERPVTVGRLEFDGRMWTFAYDDEYKSRHDLRPIEGFDDLDRVYQSSVLFPFFAVRIPDIDREDVRRRLEHDRVRDPDPSDLLRLFGRRVVSSPGFELLPA
jgi:hypothetical protein